MNQTELKKFLDNLYQRQTKRLHNLELVDVLHQSPSHLFHILGMPEISKLATALLDIYMDSFQEVLVLSRESTTYVRFGQVSQKEKIDNLDFYLKLITLISHYVSQQRLEFDQEWDKAANRFQRDFLINFGNPDGSIDWEKLVRFNSGKEKVVWIAGDMSLSVEQYLESESENKADDE